MKKYREKISLTLNLLIIWGSSSCVYYATLAMNYLNRDTGAELPLFAHYAINYSKYNIIFIVSGILSLLLVMLEIKKVAPAKKIIIQNVVLIIVIILTCAIFCFLSMTYQCLCDDWKYW